MGDPLPRDSCRTSEASPAAAANGTIAKPSPAAKSEHRLNVLHQSLADSAQSPAAVMQAATELARILTGAEGAALALRTKGSMVCRARAGDPAPELGAPVNADSGISGECLRTGSVLICNDTANDPRVDPEVCRFLGLRSIAVAPVHSRAGVVGILEGFSTRPQAFAEEQMSSLSGLAAIAQAAYEREIGALPQDLAAPPVPADETVPPILTAENKRSRAPIWGQLTDRRYWIPATGVAAVVLILGWWLSRRPVAETATKKPAPAPLVSTSPQPIKPTPAFSVPTSSTTSKAGTAKVERKAQNPQAPLKNAAQIEPERFGPAAGAIVPAAATPPAEMASAAELDSSAENPPPITIEAPGLPPSLGRAPEVVPALGTPVSQGISEGHLIHKVNPVYPMLALSQRVQGPVALDITIADDGSIREIKKVSGPPVLADAARDAIRQWRYTPFQLDGKPVEFHERITVVFKLP